MQLNQCLWFFTTELRGQLLAACLLRQVTEHPKDYWDAPGTGLQRRSWLTPSLSATTPPKPHPSACPAYNLSHLPRGPSLSTHISTTAHTLRPLEHKWTHLSSPFHSITQGPLSLMWWRVTKSLFMHSASNTYVSKGWTFCKVLLLNIIQFNPHEEP